MAVFSYNATDARSATVRGVLLADSPRAARDALRAKGLTIRRLSERQAAAAARRAISSGRAARVATFVRELAMLLGSGITLVDALDTVSRQHTGDFRNALALLRDRVSAGGSLAAAMSEQPATFDELSVSVTEVGEATGSLESVLAQLADFKERALRFRNRVAMALAYPAFVLVMALGVGAGLMTFVVPKLLDTLTDSGRPLPLPTRLVKGVSDVLVNQWWLAPSIVVIAAFAITTALRTERGRLAWHRVQLKLPILGPMMRKQSIARVAGVMAVMLRSGVVFVKAIQIAQRSVSNRVIRDALGACERAVGAGQDIAAALEATGAFPPVVVRIFAVGQTSGRLEEMLERLAVDYDAQVAVASDRLTAMLEPVLVLLLVGLIGLIACATLLPMLEAADVV